MDSKSKSLGSKPREIDYVMDPIDEIFAMDDRLSSAFGSGIVMYSAADRPEQTVEQPEVFISNRVKTFEACSSGFSTTEKRIEFVEAAQQLATSQTKVTVVYDAEKKIDLKIDPSHVKDHSKWNVGGKTLSIPLIKAGWTDKYETMYRAALMTNLERAADISEAQGKTLDIENTLKNIERIIKPVVIEQSTNPSRRRCQEAIMSYILTELSLTLKLTNIMQYFVLSSVISDDTHAGAYVRLSDVSNTPQDRMQSMILANSVGYNDNPIYGLNYRQLRQLVTYIFSKDAGERAMSKINLLSSVAPTVRPDIISGPNKVLVESIHEYFLTREEIISLVFNEDSERRATRCVHCNEPVVVCGLNVLHTGCPVTKWLAENFQFKEDRTNTTAPQFAYVRPGVVKLSQALVKAQQRIRSLPFIGKSDKEAMAYTLDAKGQPRKIGTISRNIPPLPHPYNTRSGHR